MVLFFKNLRFLFEMGTPLLKLSPEGRTYSPPRRRRLHIPRPSAKASGLTRSVTAPLPKKSFGLFGVPLAVVLPAAIVRSAEGLAHPAGIPVGHSSTGCLLAFQRKVSPGDGLH